MVLEFVWVGLALAFTASTLRFLRTAQRVRGELVGYRRFRDSDGDWLHQPIFRFTDAQGHTVTASNPRTVWVVRQPAVGQRFDLVYNPDRPAQIWRDRWYDVWFAPLVLWGVSLLTALQLVAG